MLWYDHSVLDCLRYYFSTCALLLLILSTLLNVSDWISLAHLDHLWSVFCSSISYNFLEITYHQVPYHLLQVCTIIYKFSTILRYTLLLSPPIKLSLLPTIMYASWCETVMLIFFFLECSEWSRKIFWHFITNKISLEGKSGGNTMYKI